MGGGRRLSSEDKVDLFNVQDTGNHYGNCCFHNGFLYLGLVSLSKVYSQTV